MESLFKRLKEVYARTYSLDPESDADFFDCVKGAEPEKISSARQDG